MYAHKYTYIHIYTNEAWCIKKIPQIKPSQVNHVLKRDVLNTQKRAYNREPMKEKLIKESLQKRAYERDLFNTQKRAYNRDPNEEILQKRAYKREPTKESL